MSRYIACSAALATLLLATRAVAHPTESTFRVDLPQAQVHGTALVPHIHRPVPCVVILGGRSSHDRDGRLSGEGAPPRDALRRLAEALQAGGYGSLRYDRVGHGLSKPGEAWTGSEAHQAAVAAAVIERARKGRDFTKVIVIAESEAAAVACLAAKAGIAADGYVLLGPHRELTDIDHLKSPVLVLAGSADRAVPPQHAAQLVELLAKSGHKDATSRLIDGVDDNFQRPQQGDQQGLAPEAARHARPYEAKAYHAILQWLYDRFPTPAEGHPEQVEQIAAQATR